MKFNKFTSIEIFFIILMLSAVGCDHLSGGAALTSQSQSSIGPITPNAPGVQGSWKSTYGSQGFALFGYLENYPSGVQVALTGQTIYTWAASTSDLRALEKPDVANDRIASTIYSATTMTVKIAMNDNVPHQIALYFVDWDNLSRNETVILSDATTGTILETANLSNFSSGVYLVWKISGTVNITIVNSAPSVNAVLSGIFFGGTAASQGCLPPPHLVAGNISTLQVTPGQSFTMSCDFGKQIDVIGTSFDNPGDGAFCTYVTFNGTAAQMNCVAGTTPGTFSAGCDIDFKASDNYCASTVSLGNLVIMPAAAP